ncbi:Flagellar biosynthetic protein FliP precursor [Polystyrenella longa]|uniref:Flagellar biosynthetic protein FliP n=1 Tax=Polystyrenella longa TaxID=2528007 RepID=A0A518CIR6_9PLAN|nr:flagellar type III secretion system pore protein FliP [Polystyrenella longa]QDU79128.1 Flagellar biosynthetic protein FliP precursor [Polystyrenella longa]
MLNKLNDTTKLYLKNDSRKWHVLQVMIVLLTLLLPGPLSAQQGGQAAGIQEQNSPDRSEGFSVNQTLPNLLPQQTGTANGNPNGLQSPQLLDVDQMLSPEGFSSTLKVMLLLTVISLAPSIMIMTTSFIRFVIVFGLLRQALGTQQLPPNQVIIALCMFMTFLVMSPVWEEAYNSGIKPYSSPEPGQASITITEAYERTASPIRTFMIDQIEYTGNGDTVLQLWEYQNPGTEGFPAQPPETYEDVSLSILLPAYMLSELKTAFVIGFQVYLPFLVIDMVIATILISMGMMMLPPVLISLPFKLLLFVLIDGWSLTVGMLLEGVQPYL